MLFTSGVICQVEKLLCTPISFAVFAFLFMACTMEVVLLKLTTSAHIFGRPPNQDDWDEGGQFGEEDIYYENLENNYEHWARRRLRYHQRQQQLLQQQQQQQQQQQHQYL
ncbi:BMP-2-inducible protein kinase [Drosophila navojoa]|uniref:BMP-2-inducible protein kinase n=1 Tax=Drosophila navojoa TaxID=7232 RepID=UPI00084687E8|nr:BMP-2-inducible protein kinase [Drosophila navojoa]